MTSPSASSGTPTSASSLAEHRLARLRHAAPRTRRRPRAAGRGRADAQPAALVREEDARGVRVEHAPDLRHEVAQDALEAAVRERRVHERLHAADDLRHALRLGARRLLAEQRLALGLPAQPLGDVDDEAGDEHLAARRRPSTPSPRPGKRCPSRRTSSTSKCSIA